MKHVSPLRVAALMCNIHVKYVTLKIALNIPDYVYNMALFVLICMPAQVNVLLISQTPILNTQVVNAFVYYRYIRYQVFKLSVLRLLSTHVRLKSYL